MPGDFIGLSSGTLCKNAVVVSGAVKSYGCLNVLNDLHMTVPKGTIYGLLGASGCGKTTLLGCLIGRKLLNSGDIYVLDQKVPNARIESRIGYMPQRNGLYGDFTIKETLLFFGRVLGIDQGQIIEKAKYLAELLMLPYKDKRIKYMSGGEQRRISLAIALLNDAELLILDEPTVGLDSILRQMVWDHLLKLTADGKVTIIITTHYIEESLRADLVGIMRGGCLIAEDSPKHLLEQHHAERLEEVFLKLSLMQKPVERTDGDTFGHSKLEGGRAKWGLKRSHLKAMIYKNYLLYGKNIVFLVHWLIFPLLNATLYCLTIGHIPSNMFISVANMEMSDCNTTSIICDGTGASCAFLRHLQDCGFIMKYYSNHTKTRDMVEKGEAYASIVIKENFSMALHDRGEEGRFVSSVVVEQSTVDIFRDLSDWHLASYMKRTFYQAFETLLHNLSSTCDGENFLRNPVKWGTVYDELGYTDFALPGMLIMFSFLVGIMISGTAMIVERTEGDLDRLFAMGISTSELFISHLIVDYIMAILQTFLLIITTFVGFKMVIKGSLLLAFTITTLTSVSGICYGLMLSSVIRTQFVLGETSILTIICTMSISGFLWPVQGAHWILKPIIPFSPFAKPVETLRNILHHGWGFQQPEVYLGFVCSIVWTSIFLLLSVFFIRIQRD